jgi:hypothetical protein
MEFDNNNEEKRNKSLNSDDSMNNDNNKSEYDDENEDYYIKIHSSVKRDINSYQNDKNDNSNSFMFLKENLRNNEVSNFINPNDNSDNNNNSSSSIDNRNNQLVMQNNMSLEKEINQNQQSFITYLIGFLNDYYKKNRIVIIKGDGSYQLSRDEDENNILDNLNYDTFLEEIPLNKIQYNGLTINLIKKYLKTIFPDENTFDELFINKIDQVLSDLKKNEKIKNKEIICKKKQHCLGSKNGRFKLSSIEQFKYQILNNQDIANISKTYVCDYCANNIQNI